MKKTRKKGIRSLAILLVLVLTLGFSPVTNVEAKAAPRLNYRKVTLVQGKKKKLKVRNLRRRRKVKWYSTKKSVATVNRKGVVKAKRKGKAYIVAKVGRKKYRCKVIVKKKVRRKKKSNKKVKINKSTKRQLPGDNWYVNFDFSENIGINKTFDLFRNLTAGGDDLSNTSYSVRSKYFKWYSSNTNVLKINSYGIATGKAKGTSRVYCKYITKTGKWVTTKSAKIIVKDAGDVKISYTTSSSTGDKDTFDTITCTVKNNSDSTIEFDRHVYVDDGTGWMLTNETGKLVPLNPGESTVVVYKITAAWSTLWGKYFDYAGSSYNNPWTVEFGYKLHGSWVSPIHHIRGGEYWSTK